MMKNDKIIVILGVAVLILASIGVYFWVPETAQTHMVKTNDFIDVTGNLKSMPDSVSVCACDPFYPLIATPLCVNYDEQGQQTIIPLYVMNLTNP